MDTAQTIILALFQVLAASAMVNAHTRTLHTYAHTLKNFRELTLESVSSSKPVISPCAKINDRNELLNCYLRGRPLITLQGVP